NLINNLQSLEWLTLCPKLVSLILLENPLYFLMKNRERPYTKEDVVKLLPRLKFIDGHPLDSGGQKLKKFRKWMMPKQAKVLEKYSRISFDTISEDIPECSTLSEKSSVIETL
ncbi:uncharacterized protein TNIN_459021, partial [Trichonephila inaurata madagascariensis]